MKRRAVLDALSRAVQQAAPFLTENPRHLFPQVFNRLRGRSDKEPELRRVLERARGDFKDPWCRLLNPPTESPALVWTLSDDREGVFGCAFSPDGSRVVSSSRYVRLWERQSGRPVLTLPGTGERWLKPWKGPVFSPDGRQVVAFMGDVIQFWDSDSGEELRTVIASAANIHEGLIGEDRHDDSAPFDTCALHQQGQVAAAHGLSLETWRPVRPGSSIRVRTAVHGVRSRTICCAFSHDGSRLLSGHEAGEVMVWDVETGEEVLSIHAHPGSALRHCTFSDDDRLIGTAGADTGFKVWDAVSGEQRAVLDAGEDTFEIGAFSPDGWRIAIGCGDGSLRVWDVRAGTARQHLVGHDAAVASCAFSADGRRLVSSSRHGELRAWDPETGRTVAVREGVGRARPCVFSADGTRVVSTAWDPYKGEFPIVWDLDSDAVESSEDFSEEPWAPSGTDPWMEPEDYPSGTQPEVRAILLGADGERILTIHHTRQLTTWSAKDGDEVTSERLSRRSDDEIDRCAFSPDGKWLLVGSRSSLRFWDTTIGESVRSIEGRQHFSWATFAPDSVRIAFASSDGRVRVLALQSGNELLAVDGHERGVSGCWFSRDGSRIITANPDQTLKVWDIEHEGQPITLVGHHGCVRDCDVSPDAQHIVSAGDDRLVRVWEAATGRQVAALEGHGLAVQACAFSPDGQQVMTASGDGTVRLWDWSYPLASERVSGHTECVEDCAFSPDGKRVVTAGRDGSVVVWSVDQCQPCLILSGHSRPVYSAAFGPDGRRIVSGATGADLRVWDADSGSETLSVVGYHLLGNVSPFTPDGREVVVQRQTLYETDARGQLRTSPGSDGAIVRLNVDTGREVGLHARTEAWAFSSAFGGPVKMRKRNRVLKEPLAVLDYSPDGRRGVYLSDHATRRRYLTFVRVFRHTHESRLPGLLRATLLRLKHTAERRGHSSDITACAFSPDGTRVVSASRDGTLMIWSARSETPLATLKGHRGVVLGCAYSPTGQYILSASEDSSLRLWDARGGRELAVFEGLSSRISAAAISPDGRTIVFGDIRGQVLFVSLENVEIAPVVVTAHLVSGRVLFRCPYCLQEGQVERQCLGREISCGSCQKQVKLNPFAVRLPRPERGVTS